MSDENDKTRGQFVTKKIVAPAVVVDCSDGMDPSDEPWTVGQFVTKKKTRPAAVIDCAAWEPEATPVHLEVQVTFADSSTQNGRQQVSDRVLQTLHTAAADLGFVYDQTLSIRGRGAALLALVPQTPPANVEERLQALLPLLDDVKKHPEVTSLQASIA